MSLQELLRKRHFGDGSFMGPTNNTEAPGGRGVENPRPAHACSKHRALASENALPFKTKQRKPGWSQKRNQTPTASKDCTKRGHGNSHQPLLSQERDYSRVGLGVLLALRSCHTLGGGDEMLGSERRPVRSTYLHYILKEHESIDN